MKSQENTDSKHILSNVVDIVPGFKENQLMKLQERDRLLEAKRQLDAEIALMNNQSDKQEINKAETSILKSAIKKIFRKSADGKLNLNP